MASSVYSYRLMSAQGSPLFETYTVPAGFRAIVRDIDAWYTAGDAGQQIYAQSGPDGAILWLAHFGSDGDSIQWRGRQVIDELGELTVASSGSLLATVSVSGYLLTLP